MTQSQDGEPDKPAPERVVCRGSAATWIVAVFGFGFFVLFWSGPPLPLRATTIDYLLDGFISSLFLASGLFGLYCALLRPIVADTEGLAWRHGFGWKSTAWADISDYYLDHSRKEGYQEVIVCKAGTLRVGSLYTSRHRLREIVAANATSAAHREWRVDPWGTSSRPEAMSHALTFRYHPASRRVYLGFLIVSETMLIGLGFGPIAKAVLSRGVANISVWPMEWVVIAFCVAVWALVVTGYAALFWPLITGLKRRERERLTLSESGLDWTDGQRRVESSWAEVTKAEFRPSPGVSLKPARCRVETRAGNFDLLYRELGDCQALKAIFAAYCPPAAFVESAGNPDQAVVQPEQDSSLRFNFRTSAQRMNILLAGWAFVASGSLFYASQSAILTKPEGTMDPGGCLMMAMIGIPALPFFAYSWAKYRTGCLLVTADGLEQRLPYRREFIPWNEVTEYSQTSSALRLKWGEGRTFRIPFTVSGYRQLWKEIRARAINAPVREWEGR